MATERFEHVAGDEGSDHVGASESRELAGPTKPDEHTRAGATAVRGCGVGGNINGWRRHRQARPHLHGTGLCTPATAQLDLREATHAAAIDPARAMGWGVGVAPTLAAAFSIDSIADQAQVMRTCSPHVNTRTRQKTGSWTNETLQ